MNFKSSHHSLNIVPRLALTTALAALLAACGDGPLENKGPNAPGNGSSSLYEDWRNGRNGQNEQAGQQAGASTPSNASNTSGAGDDGKTDEQRAAEAEAAARAAAEAAAREQMSRTALELAIAMQADPVRDPGKKMIIVGLDNSSLASNNQEWLNSPQFAGLDDAKKQELNQNYVSLTGADLYEYFRRKCPVTSMSSADQSPDDPNPIYRCLYGIYYGKNSAGKACFTSIGPTGKVRHVNDIRVISEFQPGAVIGNVASSMPSEFTRADAGGSMFMIFNGTQRSPNPVLDFGAKFEIDEQAGFRSQQIVFKFDSSASHIEIFQKNNDPNFGTGAFEDTCLVDFKGSGSDLNVQNAAGAGTGTK